ncbi:MAG: iron transporter [Lachnospiraceae bacterium]|nr:iron transporter [Lachnospiraceae bacterium]MBP3468014.1 iron transporter [Lachnospiraceae bacterium]
MKRKLITILSTSLLVCSLLCGCADNSSVQENEVKEETVTTESSVDIETEKTTVQEENVTEENAVIPDGTYTVDFDTDSSMFHVSEACNGKGTLTVKNGEMTIHISLMSKKIINLYPGLATDAEKDGAQLLMPTEDTVTYSDGLTEEVYGFDVPVPVLEEEFDLALIGTKGTWYDHKVKVSNPEPLEEEAQSDNPLLLEDGNYSIELAFEGGSGKAKVLSPATVTVSGETVTATIQWSSPNYDYMLVNGEKYLPINTEGDSVFEIPILIFDEPMDVIGDTVAMSKPHEIEYTLTFYSDTMKPAE